MAAAFFLNKQRSLTCKFERFFICNSLNLSNLNYCLVQHNARFLCNHGPFFKTLKSYFSISTTDKFPPVSIALSPINDIQTQTDEKPRTPKKTRNSWMKPNIEKKMEVGNKILSIIPNEENIDEKPRTHKKSRNSLVEPIVEEVMKIGNKSLSIIPDGENIDSNDMEINPLVEYEKTMEPETNDKIINSENKSIKQSLSLDSLRINMEANQVHPLFGNKIHTLSRSSLPSKLQIINFICFKIDSTTKKQYSRKEKIELYREVAKDLISIWREAYIVCSDEECVIDRIKRKLIPLLVAEKYRKYANEERKKDKLLELKKIFDIARCPCFR